MTVNAGQLKPLAAIPDHLLVPIVGTYRILASLITLPSRGKDSFPGHHTSRLRVPTLSKVPVERHSDIVASSQADGCGEASFEVIQVLGIDLLGLGDKGLHLCGNLSLNLQLLHVSDVIAKRVLPKEVAHEDLLDVRFFVEAGAYFGKSARHGAVSDSIWLPQTEGLDCIHFF